MSSCHLFLSILKSDRDFLEGLDQCENSCEFSITGFVLLIYLFKKKSEYDKYASKKKLINCLIKKKRNPVAHGN